MTTNRLRFADGPPCADTAERKMQLRAYMKTRRGDNENRDVKEELLLQNLFSALDALFGESEGAGTERTYFVYLSFSSEAPTDRLIQRLTERGDKVCCPRIENGEMYPVLLGEDLTLTNRGIREPVGKRYEGEIDAIVAPMLAADKKGNRLGYGGGYYDRFFKRYERAKRIGYGYDFQIVNEVPTERGDERVDMVATDKQVFYTERENGKETKE